MERLLKNIHDIELLIEGGDVYDYDPKNPSTLRDVLRRCVEDNSKPKIPYVTYYPLESVYSIREYGGGW